MDVFRIVARAVRKAMGIPRTENPFAYVAYRRYLAYANVKENTIEEALKRVIDMLPKIKENQRIVLIAPGQSGRRLGFYLREGLKEYNPNNVKLHRINLITLPVSIRDSRVIENGRERKPTPEEMAELLYNRVNTPIYKNLARKIKSGEVVPVYLDTLTFSGRTEAMYRAFFKRLGVDPSKIHRIVLVDKDSAGMDALWDFAGNLIESPGAFPLHIRKEKTEVRVGGRRFVFNRYVKRDLRREEKREIMAAP